MAVVISPWTYWPQFNLGKPLYNGNIYIGVADTDPEIPANQKSAFLIQESGAQIPAEQPIKIGNGGVATYNGSPVAIDVTGDYSLKVTDKNGVQVYYFANGGEVEDLLQTDLRSVMFDLGLVYSDIGVTLVTSTAGTSLDGAQYIVDVDTGAAWSLPEGIPSGSTVVSISGSTLTTNNGDFELTTAPNQQSNLDDMIAGTYRSPENRLKSLQQWNISDNDTDPLISSTPTDYAVGEFPAKNVEVTTASTQLKYVSGVVSSDDDVGVLTVTFANDNPDISSENQYVGVILSDGSQAEAGVASGVTKSGLSGEDITCSVDLSIITSGFKWFFIMPERGVSYPVSDDEAIGAASVIVEYDYDSDVKYEIYGNGKIVMWGIVSGGSGPTSPTFPFSFPNKITFANSIMIGEIAATELNSTHVYDITTSGLTIGRAFALNGGTVSGSAAQDVYWTAIGN